MSRSSQPNWNAQVAEKYSRGVCWHVYDINGSGRAYRVSITHNGSVASVSNITAGRAVRSIDPNGPTAKMLVSIIRNQCGVGK